jgi:hypothetical protein
MNYNLVSKKEIKELDDICTPEKTVSLAKTKDSTSYCAFHSFGITPRRWQHKFWKMMDNEHNTRLMCVTSRQIGKSTALAVFALKAAVYNKRPAGFNKKTHVGIVSASEEQSKKIMLEIRRLIQMGDEQVSRSTSNKILKYYTHQVSSNQNSANNKTTITFKNGNTIVCLPPTPRIRGYSFSYVFVDEAAFIDDNAIFFEYIEPTTANTNGVIVMTTTPNGQQGWFYDLFDPDEKLSDSEYKKLWIHYTTLEVEDPDYFKGIESKKKFYYETGRDKEFEQEYDALFTSQTTAFLDNASVDEMINPELMRVDTFRGDCDVGLDFGMVQSNTVITISTIVDGVSRLIYDYEYKGDDDTLLNDMIALKDRFNIQRVVADDCPEGHYMIQMLENEGFNVTRMNFRAEKIKKYMAMKQKIKKGEIQIYPQKELVAQLKSLQQIEKPSSTAIEKPSGGRDDYPDSLLLSLYHFLEDIEDGFEVIEKPEGIDINSKEGRRDSLWESFYKNSEEAKLWQ